MTKPLLLIVGGAVGLLVIACVAALLFVDVNRYKPQLEAAATHALGMEVRFTGRLGMGFLPNFHVTAEDGRVLDPRGAEVASAKRVKVAIELFPLLIRKLRLSRVELTGPRLSIERDSLGTLNVDQLKKVSELLSALNGATLSMTRGSLSFVNRRSGAAFAATDFDLRVRHIRVRERDDPQPLKRLSLRAHFTCREIRTRKFFVSDVKGTIEGKDGVFELNPVTLRAFGGGGMGSVHADFTAAAPSYRLKCSLPGFHIDEFLRTLSPSKAADGTMDFSATLAMRGDTPGEVVRSLEGELLLRGRNVELEGVDLDRAISRFESSQNFKLVDVGAIFLAGPIGLTVTRGYDFGSIFRGAGGTTTIHSLVSKWRVEHGIAQAMDVAMATADNRIALQGELDFVSATFADVTVAAIDDKGCATVKQVIHGPFAKPTVEKPSLLGSMTGPVVNLVKKARRVLPSAPCEPFYSGSIAAPK